VAADGAAVQLADQQAALAAAQRTGASETAALETEVADLRANLIAAQAAVRRADRGTGEPRLACDIVRVCGSVGGEGGGGGDDDCTLCRPPRAMQAPVRWWHE
jgi:hypothetical protein